MRISRICCNQNQRLCRKAICCLPLDLFSLLGLNDMVYPMGMRLRYLILLLFKNGVLEGARSKSAVAFNIFNLSEPRKLKIMTCNSYLKSLGSEVEANFNCRQLAPLYDLPQKILEDPLSEAAYQFAS